MYLTLTNISNYNKYNDYIYLKCSPNFMDELLYIIKASIFYLNSNYLSENLINKEETIQLIELLKTYCIVYKTPEHFSNKFENIEESTNVNNELILYPQPISNVIDIDNNSLFEFWATFTSCWHIFVKHNLEGLYLLFITFRTFDENNLMISKETCYSITNTLLTIYPYNKEELTDIVVFFNNCVKYKSDIKSIKELDILLLK